jgi:hypothetical protein
VGHQREEAVSTSPRLSCVLLGVVFACVAGCWTSTSSLAPSRSPAVAPPPHDVPTESVRSTPAPATPRWHPPFPSPGLATIGGEIARSQVTVECSGPGVSLSTKSDSDGHFVFPDLPPGRYLVTVRGRTATSVDVDARANDIPMPHLLVD